VNYHGEISAGPRVENLNKFKSNNEYFPTLVCTDLAARGKTTRMDAKGKITSLVAKKDYNLATKIEEAIKNNENLEAITQESVRI
jgi:superfamily II DNA/RNA helicase